MTVSSVGRSLLGIVLAGGTVQPAATAWAQPAPASPAPVLPDAPLGTIPLPEASQLRGAANPEVAIFAEMLGRGIVALREQRRDDAIAAALEVIGRAGPPLVSSIAYDILGSALTGKGQAKLAVAALEESARLDPNRPGIRAKLDALYAQPALTGPESATFRAELTRLGPAVVALWGVAGLLESEGKAPAAIAAYQLVLRGMRAGESIPVRTDLGTLYNRLGRHAETVGLLTPVLTPRSRDAAALATLALARAHHPAPPGMLPPASGLSADPAVLIAMAIEAAPSDPQTRLVAATIEQMAGRRQEAIAQLQAALRLRPNFLPALLRLASLQREAGDLPGARASLSAAAALAPQARGLRRDLAELAALQDRSEAGLAELRRLAAEPDAVLADQVALAQAQLLLGQADESVATIEAAVRRHPTDAAAHQALGTHLALLRRYDDALMAFSAGLAIAPNDPALLNTAALAASRAGRMPLALELAQRLAKAEPDSLPARFLLASLQEATGDAASARQGYEAILERQPDNVGALNNLAMLLTRAGNPAAALPLAERAAGLAPRNATVQDTLGWVLLQANRPADAVLRLREAVAIDPTGPDSRYRLALALEAAGDRAAARATVAEALALAPQFRTRPQAEELERRLQP
jgi:tetratricopeptide (TPR) repeat protein